MDRIKIQRRSFITGGTGATVAGVIMPGSIIAQDDSAPKQLPAKLVSEFVGKSHFNLNRVKELHEKEPMLINAAWDWGDGDWETGLGAAAHTGRREIAEFLLDNGARVDAFAAAMLGITPVIKSMLSSWKQLHATRGPHQIPLLSHAIVGREKADEICYLLIEKGADVNAASKIGLTPLMMAARTGRTEIIQCLLDNGANASARDAKGQTASEMAAERGHSDAVKLLNPP